jgi:hypothetical protein
VLRPTSPRLALDLAHSEGEGLSSAAHPTNNLGPIGLAARASRTSRNCPNVIVHRHIIAVDLTERIQRSAS